MGCRVDSDLEAVSIVDCVIDSTDEDALSYIPRRRRDYACL